MKIMASCFITSWQVDGGSGRETVTDFIFWGSKIVMDGDCSNEIKRHLLLGRKAMTSLGTILKRREITSLMKVHIIKAMVFLIIMYGCESWNIKKAQDQRIWCFWIVVLEKTLQRLLDSKESKSINPKGNQPWIFIGRTDAEAPVLWSPDVNSLLIEKDPNAGKDWR